LTFIASLFWNLEISFCSAWARIYRVSFVNMVWDSKLLVIMLRMISSYSSINVHKRTSLCCCLSKIIPERWRSVALHWKWYATLLMKELPMFSQLVKWVINSLVIYMITSKVFFLFIIIVIVLIRMIFFFLMMHFHYFGISLLEGRHIPKLFSLLRHLLSKMICILRR